MLDLHRLRLLHELHARGTIAAVADALRFTPSAVSQQLALLEREAGLPLLERAGRGVRLTDAALVLVGHAGALLERAALAEADLAAATGTVAGRRADRRFQSAALRLAVPAMRALAREAPRPPLRAGRSRARAGTPGTRARGRRPRPGRRVAAPPAPAASPAWIVRTCSATRCTSFCPGTTRRAPAGAARCPWPSWPATPGPPATPDAGWEEVTNRTCRELGGFDPDIRHRTNDSDRQPRARGRGQAVALCARSCCPPPAGRRA